MSHQRPGQSPTWITPGTPPSHDMIDERTPLVGSRAVTASHTNMEKLNQLLLRMIDRFDLIATRSPVRLFEIGDQWLFPPFLRRRCQAMLAAQWTHRLPLIQQSSPADMAANLIVKVLGEIKDDPDSSSKLTVVDFCSGGGGPVAVIEKLVNRKRAERSQPPIPFILTDIKPHIDAWMAASARSPNLSFIPQPVDATDPPVAAISTTSQANGNHANSDFSSDTRVFRLYCLAFHHFPDNVAAKILASTTETADGFAIFELQDRRLSSLLLMFLDFWLMFVVTPFWFWHDPLQLLFTYVIPILPFALSFDGFVSSLRTRTFLEVMSLVDGSLRDALSGPRGRAVRQVLTETGRATIEGWAFEGGREMHTWPIGHMNYIIGRRVEGRDGRV